MFEKALCEPGASVNLMHFSIFRKHGLGEADRSFKHPRGIIEDVLIKVDKFIFLANFIILDMEDDKEIPIILWRPFLEIGRALINVQKGEPKLRVQGEEVTFNVFKATMHPDDESYIVRDDTQDIKAKEIGGPTTTKNN